MGLTAKKVLFLRFSSLGDVIIANYTAMKIKEAHPDWHLTWLTENVYADIVIAQPWVDSVIAWDRKNGGQREYLKIIKEVRRAQFDILIDMHSTDRSSLFSLLSGISVRYGCERHYPFVHTTFDFRAFAGDEICIGDCPKYLYSDAVLPEEFSFLSDKSRKTLALPIGASYAKKQWGVKRWTEFCSFCADNGLRMILLGSGEEEAETARKIESSVRSHLLVNLVGKLSLKELVQLIDQTDAVVSADTGAAHIARALGIPTVVMFGPTVIEERSYMASLKNIFKTTCPDVGCKRFDCPKPCMETIEAASVMDCVKKIISER
ncbi:MAG: glycosyltransferase family 9 protein [Synergistaceae bacterium]|nr:glycosyltransferase family 9 protein [Synergistaceae bacterium]